MDYKNAGVDIDKADQMLDRFGPARIGVVLGDILAKVTRAKAALATVLR
ncbi:MAG: hypothetical protein HGB05_16010 [Chloroflexi bacterium]|nr:hypothetical protein [Chloroflexota bacterium]